MEECWSCLANAGDRPISPGPRIYEGRYWNLEHAYPTALKGWLVLVLRRHAEALHALSAEEFAELAALLERTAKLLREVLGCEKEYVIGLAEAEHFHHVHVHVVPRAPDLAPELRGARIFALLGESAQDDAVPPEEVRALCELLRERWTTQAESDGPEL